MQLTKAREKVGMWIVRARPVFQLPASKIRVQEEEKREKGGKDGKESFFLFFLRFGVR